MGFLGFLAVAQPFLVLNKTLSLRVHKESSFIQNLTGAVKEPFHMSLEGFLLYFLFIHLLCTCTASNGLK